VLDGRDSHLYEIRTFAMRQRPGTGHARRHLPNGWFSGETILAEFPGEKAVKPVTKEITWRDPTPYWSIVNCNFRYSALRAPT
jgi:hypothetical protein